MRAWVLAQLLWNPQQDDRALIKEFLRGYYGGGAGDIIERYLELMHDASKGFYLACYLRKDAPHLRFQPLAAAERLWQQAEEAASREADPEKLIRVRMGHLPVWYACLEPLGVAAAGMPGTKRDLALAGIAQSRSPTLFARCARVFRGRIGPRCGCSARGAAGGRFPEGVCPGPA